MKTLKKYKLIKMKNINNKFKNKYKIRYSFFGIKLTVKNKAKIDFYKKKKEEENEKKLKERYEIIKKELKELKKFRENKEYILTCYICTYNHANTIKKAIESILEQETKYNYLIKIIDDASTDGTTEICLEYARKYPEKVELVIPYKNTKGIIISSILRTIDTKYFCSLDGDDYWCDKNKIEIALDFLENNPEYTIWASDSIFNDCVKNYQCSYIHEFLRQKKIINPMTHNNYTYMHLSSRIHRNVIDFKKQYTNIRKRDIFIYHACLDKGPLYFYDKMMSVYNYTKTGVFSQLEYLESRYSNFYSYYAINKYLNYRQDNYFTKAINSKTLILYKHILGKQIGWALYMFFKKKKMLFKIFREKIKTFNKIEKGHKPYTKEEFCLLTKLSKEEQSELCWH